MFLIAGIQLSRVQK